MPKRLRTAAVVGSTIAGSTVGLAALATTEQGGARLVTRGVNKVAGADTGEFGVFVGHGVMFTAMAGLGVPALRQMRTMTEKKAQALEPVYEQPPTSPFVSCGPTSEIGFEEIGKEGRRFVLMRLNPQEIQQIMGGTADEPVRIVVPREGSIGQRAELAVRELEATGGYTAASSASRRPPASVTSTTSWLEAPSISATATAQSSSRSTPMYPVHCTQQDHRGRGTADRGDPPSAPHRRGEPEHRPRIVQFGRA